MVERVIQSIARAKVGFPQRSSTIVEILHWIARVRKIHTSESKKTASCAAEMSERHGVVLRRFVATAILKETGRS